MKKRVFLLGYFIFTLAQAEPPKGDFVCDGVIPPTLDVKVNSTTVCPGESGQVEVTKITSEGTMYGHYEGSGEQVSFGLSFTDVQVTKPQVFQAPEKYTLGWTQHDTITISGQYEECGGGTVTAKDYDMGIVTLEDCDSGPTGDHGPKPEPGPTPGPKPGPDSGGNNNGGGGGEEEECDQPAQPDEGVAEFFGSDSGWIVWPAPNEAWSQEQKEEATWFIATHRIVTINTPKKRDLTGTLQLNKVSGDESCVKLLLVKEGVESSYSLGQALPIIEPGHFGCGIHQNHQGSQYFGFIPVKAGELVLEAVVDPTEGSPKKNAKLKITIVEMDLDIEHPATGEVAEEKEETNGLVAVKRDEETPLTRLKLRAVKPSNIGGKYYLKFPSSLKIWQSENRTGAVTEETEFNTDIETTLFVEAMGKSDKLNDQQIVLNWKEGEEKNISYGDWVNLTAVQAEFPITIRAFIPYLWTEPDFPVTILDAMGWMLYDVVAHGDSRVFNPSENASFRLSQKVTLTPYMKLHKDGDKIDERELELADLSIHYRKETSVPPQEQGLIHGFSLLPNPEIVASGEPFSTKEKYELKSHIEQKVIFHIEGNGKDGGFIELVKPLVPAIDWNIDIEIDCANPINPQLKVNGQRDGFPAYEIFTQDSTKQPLKIYDWLPPYNRQVGPGWLNTEEEFNKEVNIP